MSYQYDGKIRSENDGESSYGLLTLRKEVVTILGTDGVLFTMPVNLTFVYVNFSKFFAHNDIWINHLIAIVLSAMPKLLLLISILLSVGSLD